jgi:hypothetical protein
MFIYKSCARHGFRDFGMRKIKLLGLLLISLLFFSCENFQEIKKPYLSQTTLNLYVGNSETLYLYNCKDYVSWSSDNKYIAKVSNGLVTANLAGETIIRANDEECKVVVKPMHTCFVDPYLNWNGDLSDVYSYMRILGYTLKEQESTSLTYKGDNRVVLSYIYTFDDNSILKGAGVAISNDYIDDVAEHLRDRYILVDMDDDSFYFVDPEQKTVLMLTVYGVSYSMIAYVPASTNNIKKSETCLSSEIKQILIEQKQEFENLQTKILMK